MAQKSYRHPKLLEQSESGNPLNEYIRESNANLGSLGEMMAALELMLNGWEVYTQSICNPSNGFDMLAVKGRKFKRIQVKCTAKKYKDGHKKNKKHILKVCKRNKGSTSRYDKNDCDFIVVLVMDEGWFFVVPTEKFHSQTVSIYTNKTGQAAGWITEYQDAWDLLDD
jgi:Holliday junction resolvase-like predicted endonuclease